jgi:arylsulfatase A-like enzyme
MTSSRDELGRQVLPIPDRPFAGLVTYDAKDPATSFPAIEPLRPPTGAPNVLIVLLDDVGFAASSAFGGPINCPTAERLAANGLKYNRFHTTALCSPTRQALLTGRNHHAVGMGGITEIATSAPGYNSIRPNTAAPLAEVLQLNGYATAQFGKCHEVPVWETSPMGPFTQWPTGSGFEHFYGFIGGETNQWAPAIYRDTVPVEPDRTAEEGYHFTEDMTDQAINWIRQQKALMADKPFFIYFAPGATHAPHHVPKEWADKYKGRFTPLAPPLGTVIDAVIDRDLFFVTMTELPMLFSADETTDIGSDSATPVSDDYGGPKESEFTGRIHWVQLDGDGGRRRRPPHQPRGATSHRHGQTIGSSSPSASEHPAQRSPTFRSH